MIVFSFFFRERQNHGRKLANEGLASYIMCIYTLILAVLACLVASSPGSQEGGGERERRAWYILFC